MLNRKYLKILNDIMESGCYTKKEVFAAMYEMYIDGIMAKAQLIFLSDLLGYSVKNKI